MTIEKAISELLGHIDCYGEETNTALVMAIDALREQEKRSKKCVSQKCPFTDVNPDDCQFFGGCDFAVEQPTEADHIRAMTDEELEKFIRSMVDGSNSHEVACYECLYCGTHHSDPCNKGTELYKCDGCANEGIGLDIAKWLKRPYVKEETT